MRSTSPAPEAIIDLDISSHSPSEHLQRLLQCLRTGLRFCVFRGPHQHENPAHAFLLLRTRRERPRGRPANERDELAADHLTLPDDAHVRVGLMPLIK